MQVAENGEGVVYLGDGAWGVEPRKPTLSFGMDKVEQKRYVKDENKKVEQFIYFILLGLYLMLMFWTTLT